MKKLIETIIDLVEEKEFDYKPLSKFLKSKGYKPSYSPHPSRQRGFYNDKNPNKNAVLAFLKKDGFSVTPATNGRLDKITSDEVIGKNRFQDGIWARVTDTEVTYGLHRHVGSA